MPNPDEDLLNDIAAGEGRLTGPLGDFGIHSEGEPACSNACPAGVDVKSYVNLIADGRFEEAIKVVRRSNPFPGVCGRVCTHPCESKCGREDMDDPVAIRALKRFAADYDLSRRSPGPSVEPTREDLVAVIGAGSAGLTAAVNLACEGFPVTVFDSAPVAGGLMAWAIPDFRLPKNIINAEVQDIKSAGVKINTGKKIENPRDLFDKGYSAVILAIGCQVPIGLGIETGKTESIIDCLDLLMEANLGIRKEMGGRALVIGGGSAALDSARTAMRLGAKTTIVYRRTRGEMPAHPDEISEAEEEGIEFEYLAIPHKLMFDGERLIGLECQRTRLGEPDKDGRRRPMPVPDDFFTLETDRIITAIGSKPDTSFFKSIGLETTEWGAIKVDGRGQTSIEGMFAAGDVVTGPSGIIDAIGGGNVVAGGVLAYLTGQELPVVKQQPMLVIEGPEPERVGRASTRTMVAGAGRLTFDETDVGLDEISALAEASRCRRCGTCSVCDICLGTCEHTQAVVTRDDGRPFLAKVPRALSEQLTASPDKRNGWTLSVKGQSMNVTLSPLLASVDPEKCISCGLCDDACVYRAIRIRYRKDTGSWAVVDPSACRGCGACSAVCPTGAVDQWYMADAPLTLRVGEAAREGAVLFSCIWRNPDGLSANAGTVPLTCTRRLSPHLVLEALAADAAGVAIVGCEGTYCHYLPGPWMGADLVKGAGAILEAIGLDASRLKYLETEEKGTVLLADLSKESKALALSSISTSADASTDQITPIGRALDIACGLRTTYERTGIIDTTILDAVLGAYGLEGTGQMSEAAASLDNVPDPGFVRTDMTVAFHGSCTKGEKENKALVNLLEQAPGLSVIEIDNPWGEPGWRTSTRENRQAAAYLLKEAGSKGAELLLTDSPDCLTYLKATQRGWRESAVEILDVYTFLLSRLDGGGQ